MAEPFDKVISLFESEEERDSALKRKLEKDFMVATGQRVIKKIARRQGNKTLYGYEVKQA